MKNSRSSRSEARTREEAEIELQNVLADVRRNKWQPPTAPEPIEEPKEEPTFHELASEWVKRRSRDEIAERTAEQWRWALTLHLLPFFADLRPSEITAAAVEAYKDAKQVEREECEAANAAWRRKDPKTRGRMPAKGLSNSSINKTLKVLAQVLADAKRRGYVEKNVARDRDLVPRLKAAKPKRTWLELGQVQPLLDAAGKHRALIAAMILTGLRVSELTALRWRDLDLAGSKLRVADSKTDAGLRVIDLSPMLLDELKLHRAESPHAAPEDIVFATERGTRRHRSSVMGPILRPAIERANVELAKAGGSPIEGLTNHSLRRTFCALLYETGESPAYVMQQMGHTDASLALEVYAKVMERQRDTGKKMDALIRGDWAGTGRSGDSDLEAMPGPATKSPA